MIALISSLAANGFGPRPQVVPGRAGDSGTNERVLEGGGTLSKKSKHKHLWMHVSFAWDVLLGQIITHPHVRRAYSHPWHTSQLSALLKALSLWYSHLCFNGPDHRLTDTEQHIRLPNTFSPLPGEVPSSSSRSASCLGPKSRGRALSLLLGLLRFQSSAGGSMDVRVGGIVTTPPGALTSSLTPRHTRSAKLRDTTHNGQSAPAQSTAYSALSRTGKRAYHRALRRARTQGTARYRGHTHAGISRSPTLSSLRALLCTAPPASDDLDYESETKMENCVLQCWRAFCDQAS